MRDMNATPPKLVVVTGLSGSGKSIALNALEDAGYYCMDNLPVSLFEAYVTQIRSGAVAGHERSAIGIDARTQGTELARLPDLVRELRGYGVQCDIIFLDADSDILIQRFSETRRRHPLTDAKHNLDAAIRLERELLEPLNNAATLNIDTSNTTVHELRSVIRGRVAERNARELSLMVQSFGFKHGLPRNANFVFDVRCLPNPHWEPQLRPLTGRDAAVADFLTADNGVLAMLAQIGDFLETWVPCFEREGRSYLTVAIGCTGGQHRSVYLSERLAERFRVQGRNVLLTHRELP